MIYKLALACAFMSNDEGMNASAGRKLAAVRACNWLHLCVQLA